MPGEFNVSLKLDAEVSGLEGVKNLITTLDSALKKVSEENAAIKTSAAKAKAELETLTAAGAALAKDFTKSFTGDVTGGFKRGLTDASAKVKTLAADLRAMYAMRATGDPTATLKSAIEQTETKLRDAGAELAKFRSLSEASTPGVGAGTGGLGLGNLVGGLTAANLITQAVTGSMRMLKDVISSVVSEGMAMNEFLETSKLGIATSVSAQYEMVGINGKILKGQDAYNAALAISAEQLKEIRIAGLETAATSQQLVKSFQSTMSIGASQGITDLIKLRQLTVDVTNAATALGVAQEEVPTALRAIISGREVEENTLARILVGTGEQVRQWRAQGVLMEKLNERVKVFSEGAKNASTSWAVVKSNITEAFQVFSGQITSGLFSKLSKFANEALAGMFDIKSLGIAEKFSGITNLLKDAFSGVGTVIVDALSAGLVILEKISDYIRENETYIQEWKDGFGECWSAVKSLLTTVVDVFGAMVKVDEETGKTTAQFNGISLIVKGIAVVIGGIADGIRMVAGVLITAVGLLMQGVVVPLGHELDVVGKALNQLKSGSGSGFLNASAAMKEAATNVRESGLGLIEAFTNGQSAVQKLTKEMEGTGSAGAGAAEKIKLTFAQAKTELKAIEAEIIRVDAVSSKLMKGKGAEADSAAISAIEKYRQGLLKRAGEVSAMYGQISGVKNPAPVKAVSTKGVGSSEDALAKAQADAAIALAKDAQARAQAQLDADLAHQLVSIQDFYNKKQAIQLDALRSEAQIKQQELDLLTAKAGTGTESDQNKNEAVRVKLQTEIVLLKRKEGDVIRENAGKEVDAVNALQAKLLDVKAQLEQATGTQTADTSKAQIEAKFAAIRAQAQIEGDTVGIGLIDQLVNVEEAKAKFAIIQTEYQNMLAIMQLAETDVRNKEQAGILSSSEAASQLNALHQQTGVELQALIPQMQEYAGVIGVQATTSVNKLTQDLGQMTTVATAAGKQMSDSLESSFSTLFEDIATGSKSASDAVGDFARSVVASIARIAAQQMASSLMSGIFGGSGGGASFFSSMMKKADGGIIPGTGTRDTVPALLTPGEFVIKRSAVSRLGVGFLTMLNGLKPRINTTGMYADGGLVQSMVSPDSRTSTSRVELGLEEGLFVKQMEGPMFEKKLLSVIAKSPKSFRSVLG